MSLQRSALADSMSEFQKRRFVAAKCPIHAVESTIYFLNMVRFGGCRLSFQGRGMPFQVLSHSWCVSDPRIRSAASAVGNMELPVRRNMIQNHSNDSATVQPDSENQTPSSKTNCSRGQNNLD